MRQYTILAGLVLAVAVAPVVVAREVPPLSRIALDPEASRVAIRTYGLGLLPLDGRFARFHGVLRYGSDAHGQCTVALQVDVASLTMGSDAMTAAALGPDFLDAAHYPVLAYAGACGADGSTGQLTMHGVTRPFALTFDWTKNRVTAEGRLQRADWGMTALPLLGGRTVRITVTARLSDAGR